MPEDIPLHVAAKLATETEEDAKEIIRLAKQLDIIENPFINARWNEHDRQRISEFNSYCWPSFS